MGGVETELLRSEGCQDGIALIYIHGGAFIAGRARDSRGYASNLAAQKEGSRILGETSALIDSIR